MNFPKVNPKQSFPELENEVLHFWKQNDTFQKSIDQRPADNPYRFYDGPPFITGTPHYGSLLSSIIKDIVPRYHTMQGKRVERKWGWDCHGLPIEEKVQKKLGLSSNREIEETVGIEKFIEECYTYTNETSAEWDWYIDHIGRWVDMKNAYRTMDQDYMESVLWVFKTMWDKGLIYKGQRVSLFSWKLSTPISNFEVAMDDSYEEVSDPAITVMFPLTEGNEHVQVGDYLLAWTTTPWTIPAHMAIAVNPELAYSRVKAYKYYRDGELISIGRRIGAKIVGDNDGPVIGQKQEAYFIVATARVEAIFGKPESDYSEYEIVESFQGKEIIGLKYEAPFGYYQDSGLGAPNFTVLPADFVTDDSGTGIAHEAPEFGDVDFQLAKEKGVHISNALDDEGKYTSEIGDYEGMHYQEANDVITEKLKDMGRLFKKESITHRVAMDPRTGTPLIYKAQDSWFVDIASMKSKLISENEGINWQPAHLKHGQFLKSMETAPDWCISRSRYWGTPMPIWKDSKNEMVVLGSREEIFEGNAPFGQLEKRDRKYYFTSGQFAGEELNLHRPYIDDVFIANTKNFVAKKVLGIHGCSSNIEGDKWVQRKEFFKQNGMDLDLYQFDMSDDPTYESWKEVFDTIDFSQYDAVYTSSLGGLMTTKYILENNIPVKRLVMAVPGMSINTQEGRKPNVMNIHKSLPDKNLTDFVDEIIVIHAKDDDDVLFENGKKFAEETGAVFIERETGGHPLNGSIPLLTGIIKHGEPLQRLPEVLDVWMDSGSMPYAQEHYPFSMGEPDEVYQPKKVLGVHGYRRTSEVRDFFEGTKKNLEEKGIEMIIPTFEQGEKVNYENWEKIFSKNISGVDTIVAHSLGVPFTIDSIIKNGINIKRLILVAPPEGNHQELQEFFTQLQQDSSKIGDYVEEIVIIYSRDDTPGRVESAKKLQKIIGGNLIEVDGLRHFNIPESPLIEDLVQYGKISNSPTPSIQEQKKFLSYPADFIVEYIGQVRAWFYVMHVVGVAVFDERSFTNVITTGIVNGSDGRKMSKSYGNYPDPKGTIEKYGADAIRFYMANSPLLNGGNMDFKEEGILEVIKKVLLPLWNTYSFFTTYANIDNFSPSGNTTRENPLDIWIISEINTLIDEVTQAMERYEVTDATRPIVRFMDNLTNWYIRRSRKRFWKSENDGDKLQAYETLYEVLTKLTQVMAPFTPFVTEHIYQNLTGAESVHLTDFPTADSSLIDTELNTDMDLVQKIINLGLSLRTRAKIRVRQPLQSISIGQPLSQYYKDIIKEELNVKEVLEVSPDSIAQKICKPDGRKIGPKYGGAVKDIIGQAKAGNFIELPQGQIQVGDYILEPDEYEMAFISDENSENIESGNGMAIAMNLDITPELELEGYARDLVRYIQEARKQAGYQVDDRISVNIKTNDLENILQSYDIFGETLSSYDNSLSDGDIVNEVAIGDDNRVATIILKK